MKDYFLDVAEHEWYMSETPGYSNVIHNIMRWLYLLEWAGVEE